MSKNLLTLGLGLALSGLMTFSSPAELTSLKRLPGHVPRVVPQLTSIGALSATTNLQLVIGLPLRNRVALTNLLQGLYDPGSPNYHHYLTPDEFTAQFGPTPQDYQAVMDFAHTNGLQVVGTHPNRMLLDVRGRASDVERAFHISLMKYRHPSEPRSFYAPDVEPSVRTDLPILDISGLSDYPTARPMLHQKKSTAAKPAVGSGFDGSFLGSDFRNAYVPGTSLNGSGQAVGLFQLDGYFPTDISTYESLAGLTNVPLQNVLLDGATGSAGANNDEVCLDIEMAVSMAPALSKVVVFEAPNNVAFWNDILSSMASSNSIKQLSSSWGYTGGGGPDATTHQIFQQMAAEGQTFFQASGDGNAWVNPIWQPAEDPLITVVGGSELTMRGSGNSYGSESVWNSGLVLDQFGNPDPWFANGNGYWGSGGGVAVDYAIPSWQTNVNPAADGGSSVFRNIPDVALTADNVFVVFDGGFGGVFMGTSCAAPLWAGYMSLVNQQAANEALPSAGFINPTIYALATTPAYTNDFHDIVAGNNTWPGSPSQFFAISGYDLCTGLGTPNGINLINAILTFSNTITHVSPPPPPYGTNLAVLNGSNPNGNWLLFVQDDTPPDAGVISNGWILNLTTANPVGFAADQGVTMAASVSNILVGGTYTYYITVTNSGPSTCSNSIVTDDLSPDLILISSNASLGSITVLSGPTVVWNVSTNLTPGTGGLLTLTVRATAPETVVNTATATSDTADPNSYDDSASADVVVGVITPPLLSASVINSGHNFQFSVVVGAGMTNVVQESTNLTNPNGWAPVATNVGPFLYIDTKSTNYPARFYRDVMFPGP